MHIPESWILMSFIGLVTALILLLHLTKLGHFIHQGIPERPHRRLFLASISFFIDRPCPRDARLDVSGGSSGFLPTLRYAQDGASSFVIGKGHPSVAQDLGAKPGSLPGFCS